MNSESVRQIVSDALELEPGRREAFVRGECGGDALLLAEVMSLLTGAVNANEAGFFDSVTFVKDRNGDAGSLRDGDPDETVTAPIGETAGDRIGPYKLLQQIGEGGFGVVFMAEQETPVKRRVALKVIKAGMDTRSVIARFEAERQALAMMDHPNIARVLDAGATETGRPYFVMELVKGIPVTDYCDQASFDMRQRLELFMDVCAAVQHAHQKGIIHRDLKPSNIMVTLHDTDPVVKVIDFGIAKATDQKLTEKTLFTGYGQMVGTPAYMSPEQAVMSGLDVDTRSDVYSLGVLLYELLVGSPPFDAKTLRGAGFEEMRRIIREVQPARPSTKASTLAPGRKSSVAAHRQVSLQVLSRQLRGELDWIVLKAIEKDRNRRYESASAFAKDIQNYLNSEPISAGAPGTLYRMRKFMRRHRAPVAVAAIIIVLLLSGTGISLWEAFRAIRAERVVLSAQMESEAVLNFLEHRLLEQADTGAQADSLLLEGESSSLAKLNPTVGELLDRAAKELAPDKIERSFPNQPLTQAEILKTVGLAYVGIGKYSSAIDFLKRSLDIYRQKLGQTDVQTLNAMNNLAAASLQAGEFAVSLPQFEQTLKLQKTVFGDEDPRTLNTRNNLAVAYKDAGKLDLAVPLFEQTFGLMKQKLGSGNPDTLNTADNLAQAYLAAGETEPALKLLNETLSLRKSTQGPEHPKTLSTKNSLAMAYQNAGQLEVAVPLFEQTLGQMNDKLGPDHPNTLNTMSNLADAYRAAGKLELAIPLFEKALGLMKDNLGLEHPTTLNTMNNLGVTYETAGEANRAIPLLETALRIEKNKRGPDHPATLRTACNLAIAQDAVGSVDLAMPLLEKTFEQQKATLGPEHRDTLVTEDTLLVVYDQAKEFVKSEPLFRDQLSRTKRASGEQSPQYASASILLGRNLLHEQKWSDAETYLHQGLLIRQSATPDAWLTFNAESLLGESLLGQRKYADAETNLLSGYQGMKQREGTIPLPARAKLTEALDRLIKLYTETNRPDEAKKWESERVKDPTSAPVR